MKTIAKLLILIFSITTLLPTQSMASIVGPEGMTPTPLNETPVSSVEEKKTPPPQKETVSSPLPPSLSEMDNPLYVSLNVERKEDSLIGGKNERRVSDFVKRVNSILKDKKLLAQIKALDEEIDGLMADAKKGLTADAKTVKGFWDRLLALDKKYEDLTKVIRERLEPLHRQRVQLTFDLRDYLAESVGIFKGHAKTLLDQVERVWARYLRSDVYEALQEVPEKYGALPWVTVFYSKDPKLEDARKKLVQIRKFVDEAMGAAKGLMDELGRIDSELLTLSFQVDSLKANKNNPLTQKQIDALKEKAKTLEVQYKKVVKKIEAKRQTLTKLYNELKELSKKKGNIYSSLIRASYGFIVDIFEHSASYAYLRDKQKRIKEDFETLQKKFNSLKPREKK